MSYAEDWEPSNYDHTAPLRTPEPREKPELWFRQNAAVFHALEQWSSNWEEHAQEYESQHGRRPSSTNRERNKADFRRQLIDKYGRGEPDTAWLDQRIGHLEKRGMAPERGEFRR